jgi:hypothetical protein
MIINFDDSLKIIKKNFISIVSISILISLSLSYFFFNISKTTVSKVIIEVSQEFSEYNNLIDVSIPLEDLSITYIVNRANVTIYLRKIKNFQEYKRQNFSKMLKSIVVYLENSPIIKTNNKGKKHLTNNKIIYDQLSMSAEVENEIKKIINLNIKNYISTLNSELNSLSLFGTIKDFKKNHEDYLTNFKMFKNKKNKSLNLRSFCLARCYNINLKPTQKQIDINYQYEIEKKNEIELEYIIFKEKFSLVEKILNNLDFYKYEDNYNIDQSKAAPMISFHEIFLFLFLISISLVSIFVLFKKSFDEEN